MSKGKIVREMWTSNNRIVHLNKGRLKRYLGHHHLCTSCHGLSEQIGCSVPQFLNYRQRQYDTNRFIQSAKTGLSVSNETIQLTKTRRERERERERRCCFRRLDETLIPTPSIPTTGHTLFQPNHLWAGLAGRWMSTQAHIIFGRSLLSFKLGFMGCL